MIKKIALREQPNSKVINSLSDWDIAVKRVFNMIDNENRIPQLRCMRKECEEEGRPHIAAYIDARIYAIKRGIA